MLWPRMNNTFAAGLNYQEICSHFLEAVSTLHTFICVSYASAGAMGHVITQDVIAQLEQLAHEHPLHAPEP